MQVVYLISPMNVYNNILL